MRLSHSRLMDLLERGRRKGQWKTLLKAADLVRPDFAARPFGKRVKWVNFHPSPEKGVPQDQLARQAQRTCRVTRMLSRVGQWSWEDNHDEHDELDSDEEEFEDEEEEEQEEAGDNDTAMPDAVGSQTQVFLCACTHVLIFYVWLTKMVFRDTDLQVTPGKNTSAATVTPDHDAATAQVRGKRQGTIPLVCVYARARACTTGCIGTRLPPHPIPSQTNPTQPNPTTITRPLKQRKAA